MMAVRTIATRAKTEMIMMPVPGREESAGTDDTAGTEESVRSAVGFDVAVETILVGSGLRACDWEVVAAGDEGAGV
jgi:hypothetical protein